MKRIFLFVLDSCGAGEMPDSAAFGDPGVNTLRSCAQSAYLHIPNMLSYGLGNIDGLEFLGKTEAPKGAYGKLAEVSMGKDTTIGHWEIAGIVSPNPLPTYSTASPMKCCSPSWKQQDGVCWQISLTPVQRSSKCSVMSM